MSESDNRKMYLRFPYIALICVICAVAGGVIGWFRPTPSLPRISPQEMKDYRGALVRQSSASYQFINPLLACDVGSEEAFPEFAPLKDNLTSIINRKISLGDAKNISVYVRSLVSARWFEMNGTFSYIPASLFKTFVMMAYYKEADETDTGILQKEIQFNGSSTYGDDVVGGTIVHFTNGKLYTIDQIIDQMIIYSDNDALNTLIYNFDSDTLSRLETIFKDLNISLPLSSNDANASFMSVDNYSLVFRVLYGSTYLSERYSEKALQILSHAKYGDGLVAGVPPDLTVAHKYGVFVAPENATSTTPNQLHDCGIIYYPKHPYLLCIMTSGDDLAKQQESIVDISSVAYKWLDAYYKSLNSSIAATSTPSVVTP